MPQPHPAQPCYAPWISVRSAIALAPDYTAQAYRNAQSCDLIVGFMRAYSNVVTFLDVVALFLPLFDQTDYLQSMTIAGAPMPRADLDL